MGLPVLAQNVGQADGAVVEVGEARSPEGEAVFLKGLPYDGGLVEALGERDGQMQAGGHASDVGVVDSGTERAEEMVATSAEEGTEASDVPVEVALTERRQDSSAHPASWAVCSTQWVSRSTSPEACRLSSSPAEIDRRRVSISSNEVAGPRTVTSASA